MMHWGYPVRDKVVLFLGDIGLISLVTLLGWQVSTPDPRSDVREWLSLLIVLPVFLAAMYVLDLYSRVAINGLGTFIRVVLSAVIAGSLCDVAFHFIGWQTGVFRSLELCTLILPFTAYLWRKAYFHSSQKLRAPERILVIGSTADADVLAKALDRVHPRYDLVGMLSTEPSMCEVLNTVDAPSFPQSDFITSEAKSSVAVAMIPAVTQCAAAVSDDVAIVPNLGPASSETLLKIVDACDVDLVVVRSDAMTLELAGSLTRLRFSGVQVYSLLDFCMYASEELPLEIVSEFWLCVADGFDLLQARVFRRVKRLLDISLASIGLVVALPFMLLAALAIRLNSPGPVIFRQKRVGWKGRPFELLKFRSMTVEAERGGPQWAAPDDPRVTSVGRFLRKSHFDELPQMINILRGEMSFVGPRPERPEFVGVLNESINFYHLRHYVLPGITGWAQVNYSYGASLEDAKRKLQYDLFYVCKASPLLDLRTLLRTARVVLFRQGSR